MTANFAFAECLMHLQLLRVRIYQLVCILLVDEQGEEDLHSKWVYQNPNGLNTGPLYGRLNVPCKEI